MVRSEWRFGVAGAEVLRSPGIPARGASKRLPRWRVGLVFGASEYLSPGHAGCIRCVTINNPRRATTLIEVLVSIFVMAIGLIALLALFPLGAFQMADAIRDDRVSHCVSNATALATAWNLRHDPVIAPFFDSPAGTGVTANPTGPSYPVYVDAAGFASHLPGPNRDWVAGQGGGIRRRTSAFAATSPTAILQFCTFLDDINFDKNAKPAMPSGSVERSYGYSWAYLLRRPKNSVPALVEMWVVVYQQRPVGPNVLVLGGDETAYAVKSITAPNVVTLTGTPNLRPGNWILDCSTTPAGLPGNARFYRIVGITDSSTPSASSLDVEVDSPLIGSPVLPNRFAVLDGVAEVIYRGTNWLP